MPGSESPGFGCRDESRQQLLFITTVSELHEQRCIEP